jgi:hypothetical protein
MGSVDEIGKRFEELIQEGRSWPYRDDHKMFLTNGAHGWLASAANLVDTVTRGRGFYLTQVQLILEDELLRGAVPVRAVHKMIGVLEALRQDCEKGLVREIEYLISAENFDAFLDHAAKYHRAGQARESGALVSIVFEDTLRKVAKKYDLDPETEIDSLIEGLLVAEKITPVAARRLKGGPAALRNKALHAKWDEFDIKDVGEALRTTRDLIPMIL